jgi:hypothetical protein
VAVGVWLMSLYVLLVVLAAGGPDASASPDHSFVVGQQQAGQREG